MPKHPFEKLIAYLVRQKLVSGLLFIALLSILVSGISRIRIQEDIYGIFPQGKSFSKYQTLLTENNWNKQIYFALPYNEESVYEDVETFEEALKQQFSGKITHIVSNREVNERALLSYYQQRAILDLDSSDYQKIASALVQDTLKKRLTRAKNLLSGVNGWYAKLLIQQDPYGFLSSKIKDYQLQGGKSKFIYKDGFLLDSTETNLYIVGDITVKTSDTKALIQFSTKINGFKSAWNAKHPKIQVSSFGTYEIATANATQVKTDTWLTSIISLVGILVLLLLYFRSLILPVYLIVPALFSILCGLGIMGWFRPDVNAISLATAAVLLGIVLDYSFHFFTHYKENGNAAKTAASIGTPMILGSFTTLVALGSLMFTHSGILQDFGLLALSTLGGAVIFTLFFLPVFITWFPPKFTEKSIRFQLPKKFVRIFSYVLIIGSLYWIFAKIEVHFDSDINHLSYHPQELKQREEAFTGMNPDERKKIVVFVSGTLVVR